MKDQRRLTVAVGVVACATIGGSASGMVGVAVGLASGLVFLVLRWNRLTPWSWAGLYLGRNRRIDLADPVTVANDRSGGGVRYQDYVAVVAVQILGKAFQPTLLTGSAATSTTNTLDVGDLIPLMRQSLGLTIDSISVISSGARRRPSGDYPRVYDTLIGTPPYAGRRETWLAIKIAVRDNGDALRCRPTAGTAALAAAQRIAMALRYKGIRARVATATDIDELERRLGRGALELHNRRWQTLRGDAGWQTTYAYRPEDITTANLAQAWALRVDGIVQNVTVFPDGSASATLTVRTPQPPIAPPAVMLQALPGEQAQALAATLCCPRPRLLALGRGPLPPSVAVPIAASGVLVGKTVGGDRLLMPLSDPGEQTRVRLAADDAIAKRIVIRAAAAGERITVHTTDLGRWDSVRMPNVAVIEGPRPAAGTTVSVVDGTVVPTPRPNTVISVVDPREGRGGPVDVAISQLGPAALEIEAAGQHYGAEVEFFRAENRYLAWEVSPQADLKLVD